MVALKKEIVKKEHHKRVAYIFKLLLLLVLVYINFTYQSWLSLHSETSVNQLWLNLHSKILTKIVKGASFYLAANLLISSVRMVIVYFHIRKKRNSEDNVVLGINRIATILNASVLIATFFLLAELNWQAFFASFSLVAVATVLITKDYISNTINGLIIMLSDRVSLNDYVKVGNHTGKVVDITLSNVHLLDDARHMIIIPNSTVFSSDVVNYTKKASIYMEVNFELKPEYMANIDLLEEALIRHMEPFKDSIKRRTYELLLLQVLTDKIMLQFRFALSKPAFEQKSKMHHWVLKKVVQWVRQTYEPETVRTSQA